MDTNSTFLVKIKLFGNPTRKEQKPVEFEKVIDYDLINFMDFIQPIVDQYPPGYLEVAHIQYYDEELKTFPEVECDKDLMSMFAKHGQTKVVLMFIQYCHPSKPYEPITEWHSHVQDQPRSIENDDDDDDEIEDSYLCNLLPENEHVGVDEEMMYLENEPCVIGCDERDKDYDPPSSSEDDSEAGQIENESELEAEEEELIGHEAEHIPNAEYDKENPPMTEGSTYPNIKEFKLALSHRLAMPLWRSMLTCTTLPKNLEHPMAN
ncbi:hypothetical protein HU200_041167 [Digitaria exilis]|uniref:Uncharacterized protein n=1 Tax=Digitaria exilis TaxID=1010633 RepID=A0A835B829_9POAL|nr:hypothetical protein HU200_041167 [Digitaria exilis]